MTSPIAQARAKILHDLDAAAERAAVSAPTLIAVSKVQPDARIAAALDAGQTVFGENRVQEAQGRWGDRFADRRDGLELHLIGPLQTNKAKDAVALFDCIQTLDREKLARALLKAAESVGRMPRLLVQVNTGREPQKAGVLAAELGGFLDRLDSEYSLRPDGLMCIPPVDQPASIHFALLERLARAQDLRELSMGMSADFAVAVPFGATMVRVGSALFGARDYG